MVMPASPLCTENLVDMLAFLHLFCLTVFCTLCPVSQTFIYSFHIALKRKQKTGFPTIYVEFMSSNILFVCDGCNLHQCSEASEAS